jgi:predicted type IV restriction endonuclease
LDWDLYNIEEVIREKKTSSGGKVDYELRTNGKKIYIKR